MPTERAPAASAEAASPRLSPQSPSLGPVGDAQRRSYSGELLGYYYNAVSSMYTAISGNEVRLLDNVPIYVLGEAYTGMDTTQTATSMVRAISYFTYRNRMPALANGLDHDAGWGCMIRTGQMMMSEALRRLHQCTLPPQPLGRIKEAELAALSQEASNARPRCVGSVSEPVAKPRGMPVRNVTSPPLLPAICGLKEDKVEVFHHVASLFYDTPEAPFGIHNITLTGSACARVPVGEWFTPTAIARTLQTIMTQPAVPADIRDRLEVVFAADGTVYRDELMDTFNKDKSVLLLVPVMMGMTTISASHTAPFLKLLELPNNLGIVGGRPKQSFYFVGHQLEQVFYLDPHVVQPAFVSPQTIGNRGGPRGTTAVGTIDPCMLLCFLFPNDIEYGMFEEAFFTELRPMTDFPVFSIVNSRSTRRVASESEGDFDVKDFDSDDGNISTPPATNGTSGRADKAVTQSFDDVGEW